MASDKSARDQLGVDLETPEPVEPVVEEIPEPERPEWLPEKFKDPGEFAESYKNLETELRTRAETQKEMEARIDGLAQLVENFQPQQQPQQQQDPQQMSEQLMSAFDQDPVGTMIFLANAAADQRMLQYQQQQMPQAAQQQQLQGELIADTASRVLQSRYEDWKEYEGKVGEMIEKNPALLPPELLTSLDQTSDRLDALYKQAKYDDLVKQLEDAQQNGSTTQMKRQAQSLGGNGGKPAQPSDVDVKMDQLLAAARGSSWTAFRGS